MIGIFYVPLQLRGGGTDSEWASAQKVNSEDTSPTDLAEDRIRDLAIVAESLALYQVSYFDYDYGVKATKCKTQD